MFSYRGCGLDNIWLKNGYKHHTTEEGDGVSIHNLDGLLNAIGKAIALNKSLMSGKEFRFLRIELDLSQAAIGELLGKSEQAIANWEKGTVKVPVMADALLKRIFLESFDGGDFSKLVDQLSSLDRQIHELKIELRERNGNWEATAA